jgi:hypothetical protein
MPPLARLRASPLRSWSPLLARRSAIAAASGAILNQAVVGRGAEGGSRVLRRFTGMDDQVMTSRTAVPKRPAGRPIGGCG